MYVALFLLMIRYYHLGLVQSKFPDKEIGIANSVGTKRSAVLLLWLENLIETEKLK